MRRAGRRSLAAARLAWRVGEARGLTMADETEWRSKLTPEQFHVLREHGTERPESSPLNAGKRAGAFLCAACQQTLLDGGAKYESGSG